MEKPSEIDTEQPTAYQIESEKAEVAIIFAMQLLEEKILDSSQNGLIYIPGFNKKMKFLRIENPGSYYGRNFRNWTVWLRDPDDPQRSWVICDLIKILSPDSIKPILKKVFADINWKILGVPEIFDEKDRY